MKAVELSVKFDVSKVTVEFNGLVVELSKKGEAVMVLSDSSSGFGVRNGSVARGPITPPMAKAKWMNCIAISPSFPHTRTNSALPAENAKV